MEKNFRLETLLSITSKHQFVEDKQEIYDFVGFVFQKKINEINYRIFLSSAITHLIKLYPHIFHNNYYDETKCSNPVEWLIEQKIRYGDYLPICEFGEKLSSGTEKTFKKERKFKAV